MFLIYRKILRIIFFLVLVVPAGILAGSGAVQAPNPEAVSANEKGMAHFRHGYYDLTPRGRKAEAHEELAQAEKAFLRAIKFNRDFLDAHRNLARLYHLQEKFEQAANEYAEVMRLDPDDIDNYVQMALVQTELGNFQEAIHYLETARQQTDDERIIRKLEVYIEKLLLGALNPENGKGGNK